MTEEKSRTDELLEMLGDAGVLKVLEDDGIEGWDDVVEKSDEELLALGENINEATLPLIREMQALVVVTLEPEEKEEEVEETEEILVDDTPSVEDPVAEIPAVKQVKKVAVPEHDPSEPRFP